MRLFVTQDGSALRAVVQDDRLDPRLLRTKSGDHSKFEHITSASPCVIERVRGLRSLQTDRRRGALKVAPGELSPPGPCECIVGRQVDAQEVIQRNWPRRTWGGRGVPGRGKKRGDRRAPSRVKRKHNPFCQ